jgi:hypothetical protein
LGMRLCASRRAKPGSGGGWIALSGVQAAPVDFLA